jgi:serine/threonine protein kinase
MNSKVNPDAGYSKAIDMWSIGIMTSYLLSGRNPIDPEISYTSDHKVSRKPGEFGPGTYFERFVALAVGNHAANLIRKLCEPDELRRLTAKRALEHSWFHSDRIETLYQIATADWKGRGVSIKPIEEVNFNDAHMMLKSVSVVPRDSSEYCPDSRQVPTRKAELATEATKTLVSNNRIILSQDTPILDSIRNEDQNFQDMISQDIYDVSTSHNINKLSTSRPNGSYNWDIPRSESETDSIESSRSDHAIRRPGKLPMKSCKTNPSLLFHTSIQKSKRMKHAFKRQRKEDASPLPLNLLIGDGFENP